MIRVRSSLLRSITIASRGIFLIPSSKRFRRFDMTSTSSEGIDIVFFDNCLEEEYFVDSELGGDLNNANLSENQKHQPIKSSLCKKRKCSICKQTGHIRTSCHQQNQPRDNANVSLSPTSQIFHQDFMPITLDPPCPQFTVSQDPKPSTFMDLMMEAGKNIYK